MSPDGDVLAAQPERGEFAVGAVDLGESGAGGAGDEHEPGALRVRQGVDRGGVHGLLLVEPGERSEARRVTLARREELGPVPGQLQQPDGVSGGGGVEQHVVERRDLAVGVGQQRGELVERRDLGGARTGELLGDRGDLGVGQQSPHRPDDAFPVGIGGLLGIDLERRQAGHRGNRGEGVADREAEDLTDVRGGVRRDQQHLLPGAGETQCARTGDGGLADAALAGEEHEPRRVGQKRGGGHPVLSSSSTAQQQVASPGVQQASSATFSIVAPTGASATSSPAHAASWVRSG